MLDLAEEDVHRALRLRLGCALECDGEHESFDRLRVHRRAENRRDSGRADRHDLHAERIDDLRSRRDFRLMRFLQPRPQMVLQQIERILGHRRNRDDRLRIVDVSRSRETREHGARNCDRRRQQQADDFEIVIGEHAFRCAGGELPFRENLARLLDRLHRLARELVRAGGDDRGRHRRREVLRIDVRRRHPLRRVSQRDRSDAEEVLRAEHGEYFVGDFARGFDVGRVERFASGFVAHVDEADEAAACEERRYEQAIRSLSKENFGEALIGAESVDEERVAFDGETIDEIVGAFHDSPRRVVVLIARDELVDLVVEVVRCGDEERGFGRLNVLNTSIKDLFERRLDRLHLGEHGPKYRRGRRGMRYE